MVQQSSEIKLSVLYIMSNNKYGQHDQLSRERAGRGKKGKDVGIEQRGETLIIPKSLTVRQTIEVLERRERQEETDRCIQETILVSPHEGAIALNKAIKNLYGVVLEGHGTDLSIEVGVGQTMQVRWGHYDLPMGGYVETGTDEVDGRLYFKLHAHVLGKHEHSVRELISRTRKLAVDESPYKGGAFEITLTDSCGDMVRMPTIKFLDLPKDPVNVIVRPEIERDFQTCIWSPIQHTNVVRRMGTPLRRGILLAGDYGTGKTLTATRTAQIAVENGWTFMYLPKAGDLPHALHLARQYEPCIVFVEDIDRVTKGDRTDAVNTIINSLDGIGNKNSEVMVVFTTNHPKNINPAMRRPGRIDSAINILPPDGPTVVRLIVEYAGPYLAPDQDLTDVGDMLSGTIPAKVREVVERAKLAAGSTGLENIQITAEDIKYAAGSLVRELALFAEDTKTTGENTESVLGQIGSALVQASRYRNGNTVPAN